MCDSRGDIVGKNLVQVTLWVKGLNLFYEISKKGILCQDKFLKNCQEFGPHTGQANGEREKASLYFFLIFTVILVKELRDVDSQLKL